MHIGYSLIDDANKEVAHWPLGLPAHLTYSSLGSVILRFSGASPGDTLTGADGRSYAFVERHWVDQPSDLHKSGAETVRYENGVAKVDPGWSLDIAAAKTELRARIKQGAYSRIVKIAPEWKQRNLTAQATLLAEKGRANWTATDTAAWDAGKALWDRIAALRAHSDVLEAEVSGLATEGDILSWKQHGWPE